MLSLIWSILTGLRMRGGQSSNTLFVTCINLHNLFSIVMLLETKGDMKTNFGVWSSNLYIYGIYSHIKGS